ncbi:MAG TPA: tyrosine recombinase XerC [Caldithrix abyssi]|uniref:Tyrosine recombinase XerC n=1 Tax=Caldithrix abyssi TaxID=187145 RepID=A0A7V4WTF1_CALAY|nr:tyrosine recombinase XerC [Caldithrix abyssi]
MDKTIRDYLRYISLERRYSPHTAESYANDLRQFESFLVEYFGTERIFWQRIDKKIIRYFLIDLQDKNLSHRSIARKLATLKSFFKYCAREQIIDHNPALSIRMPRFPKKLPEYLSPDEITKLLKLPKPSSFEGLRDLAILELFYGTGIRLSELINMKTSDIHFNEKRIHIVGKGNKERIVPIGQHAEQILKKYLQVRAQYVNKSVENVFILQSGNKMYPMAVQRIIKKYLGLVSNLNQKSPHILRHTYATHLLNAGASIRTVKDLLGHESLSTTQVYTHLSIDHLKSIYNQAHPGAAKNKP